MEPTSEVDGRPLLEVRDLTVVHHAADGLEPIVEGLELDVWPGETVGIVGESGSGKSITAKSLVRQLPPRVTSTGRVVFDGQDLTELSNREMARIRGSGVALMLQDPFTILNPLLRARKTVDESIPGRSSLSRRDRQKLVNNILEEVGVDPAHRDRYPFELSGGQRQRVALAAILVGNPALLIADEPTTALDVTTQAEILALLRSVLGQRRMGMILITHDLRVAFSSCDRIYVVYAGSLVEVGPAAALEEDPLHPYTRGLLLSEPTAARRQTALATMPGNVPRPSDVAGVCTFEPRCEWSTGQCSASRPALREVFPGRSTACLRVEELFDVLGQSRDSAGEAQGRPLAERAANHSALVSVRNVTKVFGSGSQQVEALKGVSLHVARQESVGILGESGSGKTTLGRCLVGLETPDDGSVTIDGVDASDFAELSRRSRAQVRKVVQLVFQDPYSSLNPRRSVGRTLAEALSMRESQTRSGIRAEVGTLLDQVGLPRSYSRRRPRELSGGERQRVAIARAMATRPALLICDEPVSALDVSVQAQILNLLNELRENLGIAYLFITHDLAVVRQVVDRAYVMYRGSVVEEGSVTALFDSPAHWYTRKLIDSIPGSPLAH